MNSWYQAKKERQAYLHSAHLHLWHCSTNSRSLRPWKKYRFSSKNHPTMTYLSCVGDCHTTMSRHPCRSTKSQPMVILYLEGVLHGEVWWGRDRERWLIFLLILGIFIFFGFGVVVWHDGSGGLLLLFFNSRIRAENKLLTDFEESWKED